jgi:hypothetical protein
MESVDGYILCGNLWSRASQRFIAKSREVEEGRGDDTAASDAADY